MGYVRVSSEGEARCTLLCTAESLGLANAQTQAFETQLKEIIDQCESSQTDATLEFQNGKLKIQLTELERAVEARLDKIEQAAEARRRLNSDRAELESALPAIGATILKAYRKRLQEHGTHPTVTWLHHETGHDPKTINKYLTNIREIVALG